MCEFCRKFDFGASRCEVDGYGARIANAGVLLFRWGQGYALAERGYEAIGGEALLLGLSLFWYLTETTIRDTVRDFRKGGRRK